MSDGAGALREQFSLLGFGSKEMSRETFCCGFQVIQLSFENRPFSRCSVWTQMCVSQSSYALEQTDLSRLRWNWGYIF